MKGLITAILDHFTEFSWPRFRSFVVLVIVIAGAFMLFDGYTSYFTMNRLNRAAEVVSRLQAIESGGKMSPELEASYTKLRQQLSLATAKKPWTLRLSMPRFDIPYSSLLKFIAGAAPLGLISLVLLGDLFKRKQGAAAGFLGIWVVAGVFGIAALLVPTFWWPWFNLLIVPVLLILCFMIFGLWIGKKESQKNGDKKRPSEDPTSDIE